MNKAYTRLYVQILVVRCQAGDENAFAELVRRFHGRLRTYVCRLLGGNRDVDDVLQDIWMTAYRALPNLQSPRAFPSWLYRTARNQAFRELRRSRGRTALQEQLRRRTVARQHAGSAHLEQDHDSGNAPGRDSVEDRTQIHAALDRLQPEHQEVLLLRMLEGMSYQHIAVVIGAPPGTVRSRLHYAREALRKEMGG